MRALAIKGKNIFSLSNVAVYHSINWISIISGLANYLKKNSVYLNIRIKDKSSIIIIICETTTTETYMGDHLAQVFGDEFILFSGRSQETA